MHYFITGATGSIGKRLVRRLLEREDATVHFLIREESQGKVAGLQAYWGVDAGAGKAIPVFGDLTKKGLGAAAADIKKLKGRIDHFYHLAAVYDLAADEESQVAVNIEGAHQSLQQRADIGARGGGRHDRPGLHLQAGADRHAAGRRRPAGARADAAGFTDRDEHQLAHVPGFDRGQGR